MGHDDHWFIELVAAGILHTICNWTQPLCIHRHTRAGVSMKIVALSCVWPVHACVYLTLRARTSRHCPGATSYEPMRICFKNLKALVCSRRCLGATPLAKGRKKSSRASFSTCFAPTLPGRRICYFSICSCALNIFVRNVLCLFGSDTNAFGFNTYEMLRLFLNFYHLPFHIYSL